MPWSMKIKYRLVEIINFFVFPLVLAYWFIFRPKSFGAVCVIRCGDEILLAKHSYGQKRWGLPGGTIKKRETPREAIIREVREEVGIKLDKVEEMGSFIDRAYYMYDTVYWFIAEVENKNFGSDTIEITEVKWFKLNSLPGPLGPVSRKAISLYKNEKRY